MSIMSIDLTWGQKSLSCWLWRYSSYLASAKSTHTPSVSQPANLLQLKTTAHCFTNISSLTHPMNNILLDFPTSEGEGLSCTSCSRFPSYPSSIEFISTSCSTFPSDLSLGFTVSLTNKEFTHPYSVSTLH